MKLKLQMILIFIVLAVIFTYSFEATKYANAQSEQSSLLSGNQSTNVTYIINSSTDNFSILPDSSANDMHPSIDELNITQLCAFPLANHSITLQNYSFKKDLPKLTKQNFTKNGIELNKFNNLVLAHDIQNNRTYHLDSGTEINYNSSILAVCARQQVLPSLTLPTNDINILYAPTLAGVGYCSLEAVTNYYTENNSTNTIREFRIFNHNYRNFTFAMPIDDVFLYNYTGIWDNEIMYNVQINYTSNGWQIYLFNYRTLVWDNIGPTAENLTFSSSKSGWGWDLHEFYFYHNETWPSLPSIESINLGVYDGNNWYLVDHNFGKPRTDNDQDGTTYPYSLNWMQNYSNWYAISPLSPLPYHYVKSHVINGSNDGALTDYQMKLVLHNGNGVDSGQDVYLDGNSLNWPYDFRFTDSSNNTLSYWIESSDANTATVWVKVPSIPANPDTVAIYLYYGKAGDSGESSGDNTFVLFDNFDGSSVDAGKWSLKSYTSASVQNSVATLTLTGDTTVGGLRSISTYGTGYSTVARLKSSYCGYTGNQWAEYGWNIPNWCALEVIAQPYPGTPAVNVYNNNNPNWWYNNWVGWTANAWHVAEVKRPSGSAITFLIDNGNPVTYTGNPLTYILPADIMMGKRNGAVTPTVYVDYIFIRKMTLNEPTHGVWSSL